MHKYERGAAIFMALFVVSIVAAFSMTWHQQLRVSIKRTQDMLTAEQAYLYAQGVVAWAINVITEGQNKQWPLLLPKTALTLHHGFISGEIDDATSFINLNNMAAEETKNAFITLITLVSPQTNRNQATNIASSINAWITTDATNQAATAINTQYTTLNPPYHAANQAMASVSESRLVYGMTAQLYEKIVPYLTVLPPTQSTNLASAPTIILQAYNATAPAESNPEPSAYYFVKAEVQLNDQYLILYNLLQRKNVNNHIQVGIIWQSRNTV